MANDPTILFPDDPILSDPEKYQAWKEEQIEIGLREADDPSTVMIPHEEVMRKLHELRKEWKERAGQQRDVA